MVKIKRISRVDMQVLIMVVAMVVTSCSLIFLFSYHLAYQDMILSLQERVQGIYYFLDTKISKQAFWGLNNPDDAEKSAYKDTKALLESIKNTTGVRYLYTAKKTNDGSFVYVVDGLPTDSGDFRHIGDAIEPEIIPELKRALAGEVIMPGEIKETSWGYIFISYCPIHLDDQVIGVLGIEFDAEHQYKTFRQLKIMAPIIIFLFCAISAALAVVLFRRISNPIFKDIANTDFLTGLKNRNAFEVDLNNLSQSKNKNQIALLSIDLDGLKKINDTYGHASGDLYIKQSCRIVSGLLSRQDILYRIGGDEFAAICWNADEKYLSDLEKAMQGKMEIQNDEGICVSFSIGYAIFNPAMDRTLFDTLKRADFVMYEQKKRRKQCRNE